MDTTVGAGISWVETWDEWIFEKLEMIEGSAMARKVCQALWQHRASLYILTENKERVGFLIVRGKTDLKGKSLDLWVLYSEGEGDPMREHEEFIEDMARSIYADRITFSTVRKGWEKVAPKYGFELERITYAKEVS